ncbi:MAG: sterol desaturase family protein [Flavobacteriaceae bacterium]
MSEAVIRILIFAAIFLGMAAWELAQPRRALVALKGRRWFTNISIVAIDALAVRLIFPLAAVGFAIAAQDSGWGLFNLIAIPGWLAGIASFVILDLAVYAQHVASHKVPVFWRLHRVHHADRDFDVTTALRFHPIEILLSMLWKGAVIFLVGAPPLAVFIFEAVLNGAAVFNHANARLPLGLDRILRLLIVTPDMHRVHHSAIRGETDSNYGFNLSFWDRIFSTYVPQPSAGHEGMRIGLDDYADDKPTYLVWSLLLPFRSGRPEGKPEGARAEGG